MKIDQELLTRFERQLLPHHLSASSIPAKMVGYGEISAIFQIGSDRDTVYKRIPIFPDKETAQGYCLMYREYCAFLKQAGICLPGDDTIIVEIPGRPVVIYFAQDRFEQQCFCHHQIQTLDRAGRDRMLDRILSAVQDLWAFNREQDPAMELAADCQLSNWVWRPEDDRLFLVDTSTPFIRKNGIEQLDVELLLQSVPPYIRPLVRMLALDDVIARYYDHEKVMTDLTANLYKEQRPDLIPWALEKINAALDLGITQAAVEKYYREDKMLWTLFSALRRLDRFIRMRLMGRRYEFILPGNVKR